MRLRWQATLATAAALATPAAAPVHTDSFRGRIVAGIGRYATTRGAVTVSGSFRRARIGAAAELRLMLRGALTGALRGTATQRLGIPDAGAQVTLSAHGRVRPLGPVSVTGEARGTGFIARGRLSIALTLRGGAGTVTIQARSGLVPGFTVP